ncbi:unnamed protein product [Chilo suppressalis]|uniref:LisH domain-containing protein n=1 Tax=Chilo suppressalis TaxID=168631 RepID=A0ABN8ASA7_CHISP|nr:unnamed protein product [Chilo suppressalis]
MENVPIENVPLSNELNDYNADVSAANFQKFIYELFEKKGVLNNLRANLRGHIVEVLKSAQTGEAPACHKNFTQRLEPLYQAINMLIAEYLLRMEFGYSLSVFVSEIPLANMVFEFARNLKDNHDIDNLKFKEIDVWSVLNYLGLKCDSQCASNILNMYSKENVPLLLCILNSSSLIHHRESSLGEGKESSDSRSSSVNSFDSLKRSTHVKTASKIASSHEHCRHLAFCKTCQGKMSRMKDRYKRSKRTRLIETNKSWNRNPESVEMLMRNVGEMEQSLVDEMFQQLKGVYEAEVDMIRQNEEKTVNRSLASHALQLHKQREEMEQSFKAREAELERSVQEKKQFLWGLARALRDQHANMMRAMKALKGETDRLTEKEDSLKAQLLEAEEMLKKRGEEMRKQITDELQILEGHLESMKKERDSIERERKELERFQSACNTNNQVVQDLANEEIRSHYDLLKNELGILKKYLEATKLEPKCVIERSTLTEMSNITSKLNLVLNNEQHLDKSPLKTDSEERMRTPNKVVNDLKKQKNVNFSTCNTEEVYRDSRSRLSVSSEAAEISRDRDQDLIERLQEENERLRTFASQQREHIDDLSSEGARLRAQLVAVRFPAGTRPRTAPALLPQPAIRSLNASVSCNSVGWRKGAGEEMSVYTNTQPRILLPGDAVPFIGALRDRSADDRRHLINQWRSLRRAGSKPHPYSAARETSLIACAGPVRTGSSNRAPLENEEAAQSSIPTLKNLEYQPQTTRERPKDGTVEKHELREKSPKSVLKEAQDKLIKYNYSRSQAGSSRDKSPSSVLREAKVRLRKLEIEAEAVENSYLDFRRRQTEVRQARDRKDYQEPSYDLKFTPSNDRQQTSTEAQPYASASQTPTVLDKYRTIVNTLANLKTWTPGHTNTRPIPPAYSKLESQLKESQQRRDYYLETPLAEFRKLYRSQTSPIRERSLEKNPSQEKDLQFSADNHEDDLQGVSEFKIKSLRQSTNKDEAQDMQDISEARFKSPSKPTNENKKWALQDGSEPRIKSPIRSTTKDDEQALQNVLELKIKSPRLPTSKEDELEILKENINKIYNLNPSDIDNKVAPIIEIIDNNENAITETEDLEEEIEAENINVIEESKEYGDIISEQAQPELLLVVESTVETKDIDISETEMHHEKISTQMTIIVSPKLDEFNDETLQLKREGHERTVSPEQAAKLTRNDALNAIFQADPNKVYSSVETELDVSKQGVEDSISDQEKALEDYPDDFSADVDNYNSRSDYEALSPVSIMKNSEDDNFWDT